MVVLRRFDPEKHHRRSIRLKGYDYTSPGAYFVTICAIERGLPGPAGFLGSIENGIMQLNDFGKIVDTAWQDLPNHNPHVFLDAFVVMPDHVHGIIVIRTKNYSVANPNIGCIVAGAGSDGIIVGAGSDGIIVGAGSEPAPTTRGTPIKFHGLPEIIRQFKTFSARRINEIRNSQGKPVWQRNYYEHIIRSGNEMDRIRKYIRDNLLVQ